MKREMVAWFEPISDQKEFFVDHPSGEIDIVLKKLSSNSEALNSKDYHLRLRMDSLLKKDDLIFAQAYRKDLVFTQALGNYNRV